MPEPMVRRTADGRGADHEVVVAVAVDVAEVGDAPAGPADWDRPAQGHAEGGRGDDRVGRRRRPAQVDGRAGSGLPGPRLAGETSSVRRRASDFRGRRLPKSIGDSLLPSPGCAQSAATDVDSSTVRRASLVETGLRTTPSVVIPSSDRSGATPPPRVSLSLCNFGPKDLLTPPNSKVGDLSRSAHTLLWAQRTTVEDPSRFAPHVLWAQLLQPSYPILFADMNLPLERAASGVQ